MAIFARQSEEHAKGKNSHDDLPVPDGPRSTNLNVRSISMVSSGSGPESYSEYSSELSFEEAKAALNSSNVGEYGAAGSRVEGPIPSQTSGPGAGSCVVGSLEEEGSPKTTPGLAGWLAGDGPGCGERVPRGSSLTGDESWIVAGSVGDEAMPGLLWEIPGGS